MTFKGDYALRALLELALMAEESDVVPLGEVARRQDIPLKYLEQIMLILEGAGYVTSRRGAGGGFALARRSEDIVLGDVVRLIEGPLDTAVCAGRGSGSGCSQASWCVFRDIWRSVEQSVSEIVDSVTYADLVRRAREAETRQAEYQI